MNLFQDRKLVIATKHKKEAVIYPILEEKLKVQCCIPLELDTDLLGTFTGEIERKKDVLTTLREKCFLAMKEMNCDLAIASEGSFGAHPTIFFGHADDEVLIFMDTKNDIEIIARELSTDTNFNGSEITNEIELLEFAKKVNFPSHALILKSSENNFSKVIKGITDENQLLENFRSIVNEYGTAYVETDMRALFNPTRMQVIKIATEKLVDTILSLCPECQAPGFTVSEVKQGLPCEWCNYPTRSTLSFIYTCKKCNHSSEKIHPHNKTKEDPMYCDFCNP